MKKTRFLVDMDGVSADLNGALLPLIYDKYPPKNIDVVFCTTPIIYSDDLHSFNEKALWLRKYFGQWALSKITLTSDKTTVVGRILIDDKPLVKGDDIPTWTHILFDQPWNQDSESIRIKGWTQENMDWLIEKFG